MHPRMPTHWKDFFLDESSWYRHPEWFADASVAPFIDPSDGVLITGFWRSGTTWLQQTLARIFGAKSVFEPLHPSLSAYEEAIRHIAPLPACGETYLNLYMPYRKKNVFARSRALYNHIRRGLRGALPGLHVRNARYGRRRAEGTESASRLRRVLQRLRDAGRTRVVMKVVRGHFLIPAIQAHFEPSIIHIRRDPRSVCASMKREGWWDCWAGTLSLERQLISSKDGRETHLHPWHDDIRMFEAQGVAARWAAYWCITERFVSNLEGPSAPIRLSYESLVRDGASYLREKIGHLTSLPISSRFLEGSSATTSEQRKRASRQQRTRAWRHVLEEREINTIEDVVSHFCMSEHLYA